jgi:hypothetical protein
METEFKRGDKVTFNAYGNPIKAKVLEVLEDGYLFSNQVSYKLEGISQPLITNCTGNSIEESTHYSDKPFSWG